MSAESDIEAIDARVQMAQATSADGVSVSRRSVADEIAWDKYKRSLAATSGTGRAFRIQQIVPSGGPR